MSSACLSYYSAESVLVEAFTCPKPENDASAVHCCGFNDMKYCCDDPNSFFPYEYEFMWRLSLLVYALAFLFRATSWVVIAVLAV
ncbi:UNVERIFIED_CONTAM: hypothetical protein FKN15_055427 [Acipenser sinensis]